MKSLVKRCWAPLYLKSYRVTQETALQRLHLPMPNQTFDVGIYVDIITGVRHSFLPDKFFSGCGWPNFSRPISKELRIIIKDLSHGMERIEVRSRSGSAHLGHVFTDGPLGSGGLSVSINILLLYAFSKDEIWKKRYGYLYCLF